ncbi:MULTISPECIES: TIGR03862 family flavoprotein [Asticcacaulis]|uniref:NAD(P)/FAD-dependent oxidoreductase n=1 Tax=Asticcacaulis TaxID=76890 RepID=UPI001AE1524D|nr:MULTISPECIES: TIGR03862 family flavoprotein [Asticcacaulis]MBP2160842.1 putative flavoprotein (TIGR03862 family) [Asticcacaulis solisilvae]MDR6801954.1 putative flavoprotein (TIGR03862 family) [Asticcacaulis sp. BE141]
MSLSPALSVAIVGAGPAGLMAAEVLAEAGARVAVYDRMPSVARKFLMAGRGGLNLTHSEPMDRFAGRYGKRSAVLKPALDAFTPRDLRAWADSLGAETFVGTSGRVFPKAMKASPLLRAWLNRLEGLGVVIHLRHDWRGWDDEALLFDTHDGPLRVAADRTILALGGASWPRLGSDGGWMPLLESKGVEIAPFRPANAGFTTQWTQHFAEKFAGEPLKNIALSFGGKTVRGEAMLTRAGLEGGAVYALSGPLRDAIASYGHADLMIDLRPDMNAGQVASKLGRASAKDSLSNRLRKALNLSPAAIGLVHETKASDIKAVPLRLSAMQGLDRAISSAGGIRFEAVTPGFELKALPGVHAIGEMLDWEAPTGGYLLQASFATAVTAARDVLADT